VTVLVGEEKTRIELLTADLFMLSIKYVFLKFGKWSMFLCLVCTCV